ncbi:OmpR Response regulators consisting of a CheY-like receiver domain and a winged-helix DNA-binding domain [Candidatus Nanopelagicaceae bacterium]
MVKDQILIVDDNEDIRFFVRAALAPEGFEVIEAADGKQALEIFRKAEPSVIILDLSIGQPDGFEVCREIRKVSTVPIIMLTSHDEEMDEAMCLAAGADDYITKPVSARILALRTTTQLRHRAANTKVQGAIITAGPLSLDTETRVLSVEGKKMELTRTEYDFLHLLIGNPKRVFTREQIAEAIGTSVEYSSDHLLDTHASRIRMKIKELSDIKVLHAVRGVGYRLMSN